MLIYNFTQFATLWKMCPKVITLSQFWENETEMWNISLLSWKKFVAIYAEKRMTSTYILLIQGIVLSFLARLLTLMFCISTTNHHSSVRHFLALTVDSCTCGNGNIFAITLIVGLLEGAATQVWRSWRNFRRIQGICLRMLGDFRGGGGR